MVDKNNWLLQHCINTICCLNGEESFSWIFLILKRKMVIDSGGIAAMTKFKF